MIKLKIKARTRVNYGQIYFIYLLKHDTMVLKLYLKSSLKCEGEIYTKERKLNMYSIFYTMQQQCKHKQCGKITSKSTAENQQYVNEETLQQSKLF